MKRTLFILIMFACSLVLIAQQSAAGDQDCSAKYKSAEAAYLAGLFTECIKTLEGMLLSCDFSGKGKERALQMLAKAYVETGEMGKAETAVNLLLKNYPHYELKESENPEMFNRMVNKYEIHPMLIIGVKNTGNWLRHKTIKSYSVLPGLYYDRAFNDAGMGYWFTYYGSAEYEFIRGLSINIDVSFFYSAYTRSFSNDPGFFLYYQESDRFIEFPIYLKKYFYPGKNFLLYASAGYGPFINYFANAEVTIKYTKDDIITGKDSDYEGRLSGYDVLPIKNQVTGQWNAGAGIGYSFKNLRFFIDARYLGGVGSLSAPEKSDNLPFLKNEFFYIDQEMKINQYEVGLTISYTLFNSVKRMKK
jgi:hypothetical protein